MWIHFLITFYLQKPAISICSKSTCNQNNTVESSSKCEFKKLLSLAMKESYLISNELLYKEIDGCCGYRITTLTNSISLFLQKKLEQCLDELELVYYTLLLILWAFPIH